MITEKGEFCKFFRLLVDKKAENLLIAEDKQLAGGVYSEPGKGYLAFGALSGGWLQFSCHEIDLRLHCLKF